MFKTIISFIKNLFSSESFEYDYCHDVERYRPVKKFLKEVPNGFCWRDK